MPGGGGQSGSTTTVQNQDPWAGQQPFLSYGFQEAQNLYQSPTPQFFPASTVTPFAAETSQALDMQTQRALGGSPLEATAQGGMLGTALGDYVGQSNPYLTDVTQSISDVIQPQVQSRFEAMGRDPSGFGAGSEFTRRVAGAVAPLAFGTYGQERARQMEALQNLPAMAQLDYANIGQLANVGAQREALGQAQLADQIQRFNFEQLKPANKLAAYMQAIQGNYGGTSAITQPTYRASPAVGALGGGLAGAQMAALTSSPYTWPFVAGGAALGAFG